MIALAIAAAVLAAGVLALLGLGAYRLVLAVRDQRLAETQQRAEEEQARAFAEWDVTHDYLRFAGRWPQRERARA